MTVIPVTYPGYEQWSFAGGAVLARPAVLDAVRDALTEHGTLYAWAARQPDREVFTGRGAVYGVRLDQVRAVVRHARRGGALAPLLGDRFVGPPRFVRELDIAERLRRGQVPTPSVLAGVLYRRGLVHRADVATERVDGTDLFTLFWGPAPPGGEVREAVFHAVGAMVRLMHAAGFVHPDLQLRNVLIEPPPASRLSPVAWLVDVDTCRQVHLRDEASRRANLARFERSWEKWNALKGARLTDDDLAAFLGGYHERPR